MEEKDLKSVKKVSEEKYSLITLSLQVIGIMTVVSGLFGVGYQKGMITTMNLGNLNGSYELREVFNSAFLGYLYSYNKLNLDAYWPVVFNILRESSYWIIGLCIFAGLVISCVYRNQGVVKQYISKISITSKSVKVAIAKSLIWSPIAVITAVYSLMLTYFTIIFLIPIAIALLVLPTLLGYVAGEDFVEKAMEKEFCVEITEKLLRKDKLRQCTQVSIKGKTIMGDIFLENKDAYFIRRNSAFLYLTKDGNNCIYSIYADSEDAKNNKDFKFVDKEIQALCNSEVGNSWKAVKLVQPD